MIILLLINHFQNISMGDIMRFAALELIVEAALISAALWRR